MNNEKSSLAILKTLRKELIVLVTSSFGLIISIIIFSTPLMGMFALGPIVSPGGIFGSAYGSTYSSGIIHVPTITDSVTIIRDIWGVPHIYGDNLEDVAFGLGYCQAQDRLFQMEMVIRNGKGLMSEILGNDSLNSDIYFKKLGIEKAAQEMIDTYEIERQTNEKLDRFLNVLDSYTAGVNYMIDKRIRENKLPIEYQLLGFKPSEWTNLNTFVYNRLMSLMLTYNTYDLHSTIIRDELFNGNTTAMNEIYPINNTYYQVPVVPTYGNYTTSSSTKLSYSEPSFDKGLREHLTPLYQVLKQTPDSLKFFQNSWIGSNNWVANGSKTTTGKPILCNDMHLGISLPHIWYEAHLVAKNDDLNVYGYTLTGTPVVLVGYNTHIAWGFTNVANDAVDWYEYVWKDQNQYWSGKENKWKSVSKRTVSIPVKGHGNYTLNISYTEDGVVMSDVMGKSNIAMKWGATNEPTYEILALMGVNLAKNWEEFNDSMQYFKDPTQNIVYADKVGNIALRPTGRFIKRNYFGEGRFILNGSDPTLDKDWEYIPFNELPFAFNPPQKYLASANQKTAGPNYPYYISSAQAPGYRGRSINRLLNEAPDGSIDVDFMKDAQCGRGGIFDTAAEAFTPFITSAVQSSNSLTSLATEALSILVDWQNSPDKFLMNKTFNAPTIYYQTMRRFREYVWEDEFEAAGGLSGVKRPQDNVLEYLVKTQPSSSWFDDINTQTIETRDDILLKAFNQAVTDLKEEFGSDTSQWLWGNYHRMYFNHLAGITSFAANEEGFPHDGSGYTLLAAGGRYVRHGPSERMVVDFSNLTNCWSVIPGGASGNPASPHYYDQALELWMKAEYHLMYIEYITPQTFPKDQTIATIILKPR
ncbi:MAG: penicillin acylase family protein, partial [Candidatus Hodarchaeales archaeon]